MDSSVFVSFFHQFLYGMSSISNFMLTPQGVFGVTPLYLLLPSGLVIYLGYAIIKWLVF